MKVHFFLKVTHLQFLKEIPPGRGTPFSLRSLLGALKHGFVKAALQPPELELEYRERAGLGLRGPPAFHCKVPSTFLTEPEGLPLKSLHRLPGKHPSLMHAYTHPRRAQGQLNQIYMI